MSIALIDKYFDTLSAFQQEQFSALDTLCKAWNQQINIISRKDVKNLPLHHILHSLSIAKIIAFRKETCILDVGTGGGFPGLPLAIRFPDSHFHLIDATAKKIKVVNDIIKQLNLKNATAEHTRADLVMDKYDFILSRAVAPLKELYHWTKGKVKKTTKHPIPNGMLCLKGGNLQQELAELNRSYRQYSLKKHFKEPFFETKHIIHVPIG